MDTGSLAYEKTPYPAPCLMPCPYLPRALPHAPAPFLMPHALRLPIALPAVGDKQNWGTSPNLNMPCALPSTCPQQGEILDALINFVNNLGNILPLS